MASLRCTDPEVLLRMMPEAGIRMEKDFKIDVNGVDVPVKVNLKTLLKKARNKALDLSNNTGRPVDSWEIHSNAGVRMNASASIADNGLGNGSRLFLNLAVGAGGNF